jgi:adenine-specific DNA-methyltransferase
MGTKKALAQDVSGVINSCRQGAVLDVFSGMCAIGQSVGTTRQVWSNDIQVFASNVASALFTSKTPPPSIEKITSLTEKLFLQNKYELSETYSARLIKEHKVLSAGIIGDLENHLSSAKYIGNCSKMDLQRREYATQSTKFPYCLSTITFADSYFSLNQAIDIDSIRYAIDQCLFTQKISLDSHRWLLIALCHASIKASTTTGHFAQYLSPNVANLKPYIKQRQRNVWNIWLECLEKLSPNGTKEWRQKNLVFNMDSLCLLEKLSFKKDKPSVVYADPPYTEDQYSRYYHIWETLVKYDYPTASGKGRYRDDRYTTPFSRASNVQWAFSELIRRTKALNSELVLSYPANGLLQRSGKDPYTILKQQYKNVEIAIEYNHQHSTMGGSKGSAKSNVKELIYWARP